MVRRIPEASRFGGIKRDRETTERRIGDLERVDGSQYGRVLERVRIIRDEIIALTAGLAETVQTYIGIYSRTRSEIDTKNASQDTAISNANSNANSREPAFSTLSASKGGTGTTNAYNNQFSSGTWRAVYALTNGQMGHASSSFALKTDVQPASIDINSWLAIPLQAFRWVDDDHQMRFDYGFIAEDLDDLRLEPWIYRNEDGEAVGVAYERLPLAHHEIIRHLHQVVLEQQSQIDQLMQRVTDLEEKQ